MRLEKKTTATLLIAIFMISIFSVAMPVGATTQKYLIEVGREDYGGPEVDLDDPTDPYSTLDNILLEVSDVDGFMVFTITTAPGMIAFPADTYSGSVVFIIDEDADGKTDWEVSYETPSQYPGHEDCIWGYEEALESGANPEPREFTDATLRDDITVARDGDKFILGVSYEKLGGPGSDFKFGIYISHLTEYWGGIPGGAGQVMIFFPYFEEFDWADTSAFPTGTVPGDPFSMDAEVIPSVVSISLEPEGVDFGTITAGYSETRYVTVIHDGNAVLEEITVELYSDTERFYEKNLLVDYHPHDYSDWTIRLVPHTGYEVPLDLSVPQFYTPGDYTGTLVFWAEEVPAGMGPVQ